MTEIRQYEDTINILRIAGPYIQLEKREKELASVEDMIRQYGHPRGTISSMEKEISENYSNYFRLLDEVGKQGLFAVKKKNALRQQAAELEAKTHQIEKDGLALMQRIAPYKKDEELYDKYDQLNGEIARLRETLAGTDSAESEEVMKEAVEAAYRVVLDESVLGSLLAYPPYEEVLAQDEQVMDYIKEHPSCAQDWISPHIPVETLYKIEDLAWFYDDEERAGYDKSEEQLVKEFEQYFSQSPLLKRFELRRDVSPAFFDADRALRKRDYWLEETTIGGQPYSANTYGKPAQFVFLEDGKVRLVVAVMKASARPNNLTRGIRYACIDQDIPYLPFYTGMPNTKHYVLRKVYEALGLVESNGYETPFKPQKR